MYFKNSAKNIEGKTWKDCTFDTGLEMFHICGMAYYKMFLFYFLIPLNSNFTTSSLVFSLFLNYILGLTSRPTPSMYLQ